MVSTGKCLNYHNNPNPQQNHQMTSVTFYSFIDQSNFAQTKKSLVILANFILNLCINNSKFAEMNRKYARNIMKLFLDS